MKKHISDSSKSIKPVLIDQNTNGGLELIAASVSKLPSNVIDRMLAHAAQELEKRKAAEKDDAILKVIEIVKKFNIPFDEITHVLESSGAIYANHSDNGKSRRIFVDPNNPKNVWSGVGRRPHWIIEKFGKKGDVSKFAVEVSNDDTQLKAYYFNPKKPSQRWNGHGRKPFWFKDLEAANENLEQYKTYF